MGNQCFSWCRNWGPGQVCGANRSFRTPSGRIQSGNGTKYATQKDHDRAQILKKHPVAKPQSKPKPRPLTPIPPKPKQDEKSLVPIAQDKVQPVLAPEAVGQLILEQIPKDNSCLFSAILKAVGDDREAMVLRQGPIPDYIDQTPSEYLQAEAEGRRSKKEYVNWIKLAESWGGEIELHILSRYYYGVQICVVDVQEKPKKILFPERPPTRKEARIYLLYNGVHYDCVMTNSGGVFSASDKKTEEKVLEYAPGWTKMQ